MKPTRRGCRGGLRRRNLPFPPTTYEVDEELLVPATQNYILHSTTDFISSEQDGYGGVRDSHTLSRSSLNIQVDTFTGAG